MKEKMADRITVRLDAETALNIDIMNKATSVAKAQIVRMILKDFFEKNDAQLEKYYEEIKAQ